ncbi:MAG TPA: LPS export ABC transporter periplasmic protein LptC [Gammaproteobacteria bacterium]|nr:LPS export ABC transporter periplasmic protein LptC [Gammaproteobacteria bacterium]
MQKLIIAAISLLLITAFAVNYKQLIPSSATQDSNKAALDFNAYSVGINTVIYDVNGEINYTIQADRQVQYNDDSTELDKPFVRLFQNGESRWNLLANTGVISPESMANSKEMRSIELSGNVEVYSLDDFGNRTVMTTQKLMLNPQLETLMTDQPVRVETSSIRQSAVGMDADLNSDEIVFHRDVRGIYEYPPPN